MRVLSCPNIGSILVGRSLVEVLKSDEGMGPSIVDVRSSRGTQIQQQSDREEAAVDSRNLV